MTVSSWVTIIAAGNFVLLVAAAIGGYITLHATLRKAIPPLEERTRMMEKEHE